MAAVDAGDHDLGCQLGGGDGDDVSLASDGKTNKKGMPNPLRLAVIAHQHLDTVVLPFPPVWTQKLALTVGAPTGRMLGYSTAYTTAPTQPDTALAAA